MFSMTGYFFDGSKLVGRKMTPQMSVLPSRALRDEDFRRLPARLDELRDVRLLERRISEAASAAGAARVTGAASTREYVST